MFVYSFIYLVLNVVFYFNLEIEDVQCVKTIKYNKFLAGVIQIK